MYNNLKAKLDKAGVELVAVSKTKPSSAIQELHDKGHRHFGENRVQELVQKHESLPKDIQWHMIGMLQKNKVKYIAHFVTLIHSIDSLKLAQVVNKEAMKNNRTIDILLQVKVAKEETKSGFDQITLLAALPDILELSNLRIRGIMGMGTFTNDAVVTRSEFVELAQIKKNVQQSFFSESPSFDILSMGMSGDYNIAVEEGSTMVRIGSLLFGSR